LTLFPYTTLFRSRGEHLIPIPGTTQAVHLQENLGAAAVAVPPAVMAALDTLFAPGRISGARYNAQNESEVDTERFAA
jgi:diketogulonate reductase-like aldo/keto reductase